MASISKTVRDLINANPMVYEGLIEGIISHAGLAENIQSQVQKETGNDVSLPAIVMAIRRYAENLVENDEIKDTDFKFNSEIIMKTGLADLTIVKTPTALEKLKSIHSKINYDKGETLNVIQGNYEITIVISEKYIDDITKILENEKILIIERDLVSLSISFSSDFLHTPGIIAKVTRKLAWENVNIFENISTMTELIFIITNKDSLKAYKALQSLVDND